MNAEDLTSDLESLVSDIRARRIDRDDVGLKLYGLFQTYGFYQQTNPVSTGSTPKGNACSCATNCPRCGKAVTVMVTLS